LSIGKMEIYLGAIYRAILKNMVVDYIRNCEFYLRHSVTVCKAAGIRGY